MTNNAPKYDAYGQRLKTPSTHKTLVLTIDQWRVLELAHKRMQAYEGDDVTLGQTVELCCADWLAGN